LTRLPLLAGRDVVRALIKLGYERDHQRGSHIVLRQSGYPHRRVVIPDHEEVSKGTLRAIILQIGLTVDQFAALL
jgi:predicted RNA binding protein YcfA (HicA-like mRNA interferase family)